MKIGSKFKRGVITYTVLKHTPAPIGMGSPKKAKKYHNICWVYNKYTGQHYGPALLTNRFLLRECRENR